MTRDEKVAKARRLKAAGVRLADIAKGLGTGQTTVREWAIDVPWPERECYVCGSTFTPGHGNRKVCCGENACKRFHEKQARGNCEDCGVQLGAGSGYASHVRERCAHCYDERRHQEQAERFDQIEALWQQGATLKEIAAELGTSAGSIGASVNRMRREGRHVPYRNRGWNRFPEQVPA